MKKIEKFLDKNYCYLHPTKLDAHGIMLHSVGCNQPRAMVFINQWNNSKRDKNGKLVTQTAVHGFIDALTGDYYQTLPYDMGGWHGGSGKNGSANATYIGIEMCEPDCIKYKPNSGQFTVTKEDKPKAQEMARRTYYSAVQVFADICKEKHFDPLSPNVIISHNEGRINGIATSHIDPEHLWTGLDLPFTMDGFRHDVAKVMKGETVMDETKKPDEVVEEKSSNSTPVMEPYKVRVKTPALRIRDKASTNGKPIGFTGIGIFTIVDEMDGPGAKKWGLLKSYEKNRNGWISLDYAERLYD